MADLTQELALLNERAAELLQKYDQAFTRLDEKSQGLAEQLVNQINEGLSQLQQKTDDGITQLAAKIQEGLNQLQTIIETGAFPRVISKPVITGGTTASIGYVTSWTVTAESYLDDNVSIKEFQVDWGDGNTETVTATENQAQISHAFFGNIGDRFQISVVAVDSLGNKSEPATLEIQLVDNQPPTAPQIDAPAEIVQGQTGIVKVYGSTDPDGDSITYRIVDTGLFAFAKTEDIAESEEVQITAPIVEGNTSSTIKAVAVDDKGLISPITSFEILIRKVNFGVVDIFGDGSAVSYLPLKVDFADLSGNIVWGYPDPLNQWNGKPEPVASFDPEFGFYNNATGETCLAHLIPIGGSDTYVKENSQGFKYIDLGTEYTVSVQIKPRFIYPFTLVQQGNYGESATDGIALGLDFAPNSEGSATLLVILIGTNGADSDVSIISGGFNWGGYKDSLAVIDTSKVTTLTFSRNNTQVDFYIDGTLHWSHDFSDSTINKPFHLYSILGNSGGCWDYTGYLKNVRIFNRAITLQEAKYLANEP